VTLRIAVAGFHPRRKDIGESARLLLRIEAHGEGHRSWAAAAAYLQPLVRDAVLVEPIFNGEQGAS
jgi:hypothetical protein